MTEQAKIRRTQDTLAIAGGAVIAFTAWSLAKICMFLSLVDENALQKLLGIDSASLMTAIYVSLIVIILIDLAVRIYIGLSARAEGHGKKKGPFYLIVAVIAAIANASSLVAIALSTSFTSSPLYMMVSIIIEVTAIGALVLVICSSMRLRRMTKATG